MSSDAPEAKRTDYEIAIRHLLSRTLRQRRWMRRLQLFRDIDFAVKKFEAADISHITELHSVLGIVRATHVLLAEHVELDPFENMLDEVNDAVGPASFTGRILMHALRSLVTDALPNCAYNAHTRRFVRSQIAIRAAGAGAGGGAAPRAGAKNLGYGEAAHRAFEMSSRLAREFIGRPHVEALVALLGRGADMPSLVANLLQSVRQKLGLLKVMRGGRDFAVMI